MNDQSAQFEPSGDTNTNFMNLALIRMQIQTFTESLRRLEKQSDPLQVELLKNEPNENQSGPSC